MTTQFRNLIFEGGGVKGIAYIGVMQIMEGRGLLTGIRRVGWHQCRSHQCPDLLTGLQYRRTAGNTPLDRFP